VDSALLDLHLDLVILKVFSNINDPMFVFYVILGARFNSTAKIFLLLSLQFLSGKQNNVTFFKAMISGYYGVSA